MTERTERRVRRSARIVLADPDDRILLFRFIPDGWDPFWCTPGGECDEHEEFPDAARRELLEETGISGQPSPLGEVKRYDFTTLLGEPVTALEHYFHLRTEVTAIDTSGHTELEQERMQEHRWFTVAELATWPEQIWPTDLDQLFERMVRRERLAAR